MSVGVSSAEDRSSKHQKEELMLSVSILEHVTNTFVLMVTSETVQCDRHRKFRYHLFRLCLCELACLCQSVIFIDLCVCLSASLSLILDRSPLVLPTS